MPKSDGLFSDLAMPLAHLDFIEIKATTYSNQKQFDYIKQIGGVFLKGLKKRNETKKNGVFGLTPNHGRVAMSPGPGNSSILIKGVGWTIGGPSVLLSRKDDELCFGLYDKKSALREIAVSEYIENLKIPATRVIGYAEIKERLLTKAKFSSGKPILPCLLYTQTLSPLRVNDLIYFNSNQKLEIVSRIAMIFDIAPKKYFDWFCIRLSETVAMLHEAGGCNDTLDWSNITLAGEITDFEWIYVPSIPLPWGNGKINLFERQEKEIIYAFEICVKLSHLLELDQRDLTSKIIALLEKGYNKHSKDKLNIFSNLRKEIFI